MRKVDKQEGARQRSRNTESWRGRVRADGLAWNGGTVNDTSLSPWVLRSGRPTVSVLLTDLTVVKAPRRRER